MTEVSIRELRNNLTKYLRRLECGERVAVTRRGKRVVTLQAQPEPDKTVDEALWRMVREGKASWSGKKFTPPVEGVPLIGDGPTPSEMIIEDRG